jgi:hypothetical protein
MAARLREETRDGVEVIDFVLSVLRGEADDVTLKDKQWAVQLILERGWGRASTPGDLAPDEAEVLDPLRVAVQALPAERLGQLRVVAREVLLGVVGDESRQTHPSSEEGGGGPSGDGDGA